MPEKISELKGLELLSISRSGLESLPEQLNSLTNLRVLKLENLKLMQKLPSVIFELENLEELYLTGTPLLEISASLKKLKKLKKVTVDGCAHEDTLIHWRKRLNTWGFNS